MSNLMSVGNNINKLIAFNPALDPNYRKDHRIFTPKPEMEVLDIVEKFQNEGWKIDGAASHKNNMGRFNNTVIKLSQPDLSFGDKGNREGFATTTLDINYDQNKFQTNSTLGLMRLICANGLVTESRERMGMINNVNFEESQLNKILENLEIGFGDVKAQMDILKFKMLTPDQQMRFAEEAIKLRASWNNQKFDPSQLIRANRSEDNSNSLWMTYNRIQENIIKPGAILNRDGKNISFPLTPQEDLNINKGLYKSMLRLNGVVNA